MKRAASINMLSPKEIKLILLYTYLGIMLDKELLIKLKI